MKTFLIILSMGLMMSCGNGATDQDATTDTTNMPVDPNVMAPDTINHINRSDGTQLLDTNNAGNDSANRK